MKTSRSVLHCFKKVGRKVFPFRGGIVQGLVLLGGCRSISEVNHRVAVVNSVCFPLSFVRRRTLAWVIVASREPHSGGMSRYLIGLCGLSDLSILLVN